MFYYATGPSRRATKPSFADKCVPKLELGNEGPKARFNNFAEPPYANGMFILMRAVSVLWTSADFAMWRLRLALFEDSR